MKTMTKRVFSCLVGTALVSGFARAAANDPEKCDFSVASGESVSISSAACPHGSTAGYWYDIQGTLTIKKGGSVSGGNSATNFLRGASADKPAKIVVELEGSFNSHWGGSLALDGYLAQPAIDAVPMWDNCWPYKIVILPTARPVDANGNVLATNEVVRFKARNGNPGFFAGYEIRNLSTIPALITSTRAWNGCTGLTGFEPADANSRQFRVPNAGNEIIIRSEKLDGRSYPFTYFTSRATTEFPIVFPHPDDLGRITVDGAVGIRASNLNKNSFATFKLTRAYDSGHVAWLTTGECSFQNVIVRPMVANALPYADDHVVPIRVGRDPNFDWSLVTNWALTNGCLDVNGLTSRVSSVTLENGAVVTNFAQNAGTLLFGANGLASTFVGTATAGVVLEKTGAGTMTLGAGSSIDTLVIAPGSTGRLTADCADAIVRVKTLIIGGVNQPAGLYTSAKFPTLVDGNLFLLVGEAAVAEPVYWVGGAKGDWNTAANWSSGAVPGAGSYLIFTNVVTNLVSETAVDISDGGMVFDVRVNNTASPFNDVVLGLTLSGSGILYKCGGETLRLYKPQTHTGGTVLTAGSIYADSAQVGQYGWGTGPLTIDRRTGADPYIYLYNPNHDLTNDVRILGSFTSVKQYSIAVGNCGGTLKGRITAEDDFTVMSGHVYDLVDRSKLFSDIDAPGRTMYVRGPNWGSKLRMTGNVNCSLNLLDNGSQLGSAGGWSQHLDLAFEGTNLAKDASLHLRDFTNTLTQTAVWAGTNVVLGIGSNDGKPYTDKDGILHEATLVLNSNENLSPEATLRIAANCHLQIARGVKVAVRACLVDGVGLPNGIYTHANRPDLILGEGRLKVGPAGTLIVFR